ncbi:ATP-binding protein [uncultured Helicobacter sp.]|uniref:AAA family ATPase n=1 Tax=uncultured Helicobacter sp. TaxID=175537 RepID=UPI002616D851|nr:ATP-binding protein [uncultured Helicobacter sp.]
MSKILPLISKSHSLKKLEGVNILLYGGAGTGKTELVKAISKSLKAPLYEVSYSDDDGSYITGTERMGAYRIAQSLLRGRKLLMYDEAEDILYGDEMHLQKGKAWINRSLESNKIPTFWITNKIGKVDEAIIRRFDYVLHLPIPSKQKRKAVLKKYCDDFVSEEVLEELSSNEYASPALIQRASRVARLSKNQELFSPMPFKLS